ncbi:hypothetical protein GCM10009555_060920 [Acrocarpospora macrocephala]|uniref:Polymerase/histidinol phosphatase N-terminal domain-containing protein n=1 Tax=Acrocarpospora macrocephala TaxID=150177 RepID=A0A5M3WPJ4_9ACTN|nr:hypothetical protein [Acrocarpospora macrocephala]GES10042.1 hypothetical protein Amac_036390 [Acrocarpospora macrocephala]
MTSPEPPERWYRGNTHTHTSAPPASDANGSPRFAADWYRRRGYDFLFITDHEHLTDVSALNSPSGDGDFLVLPGQEITQMIRDETHPHGVRQSHINGLGTDRVILPVGYPELPPDLDALWRACPPGGREALFERRPDIAAVFATYPAGGHSLASTFHRNVAEIRAAGGIPQINHPNLHWSVRLSDLMDLPDPYLMEVWNAFSIAGNLGGVSDSGHRAPSTEGLWDELLSAGKVVWAVASDDVHEYEDFGNRDAPTPGKAWIVVRAASLSRESIMGALLRGDFYASTGIVIDGYRADPGAIEITLAPLPSWRGVKFPALTRFTTRFTGAGGRLLAEGHGAAPRYEIRGDEGYVRATITDGDGRRAWTQPVFLDGRAATTG